MDATHGSGIAAVKSVDAPTRMPSRKIWISVGAMAGGPSSLDFSTVKVTTNGLLVVATTPPVSTTTSVSKNANPNGLPPASWVAIEPFVVPSVPGSASDV